MFELKVCLQRKKKSKSNKTLKLCASFSADAALWKCTHKEELKMSTRTTIWKRKHAHEHEQGEQNKQSVFICYHCGVRSGAKPHVEGAPIRRRSWQTQYSGRRCPRPLSSSLSPPSRCLDLSLPPSHIFLSQRQAEPEDNV